MTINAQPLLPIIVPESAPFSEDQRAWLNGFFAGLVSLDQVTALSADRTKNLLPARRQVRSMTATTTMRPGTTRRSRSPNA